tara:strand:- start:132 stop:659 length:528 start_codon:yes stop_codon:yes gene_type:complete
MSQKGFFYMIVALTFVFVLTLYIFSKKRFNRHKHNRKKAEQVIAKIQSFEHHGQQINYLRKIDPFVFEELLLNAFQKRGYKVIRNKRYTGDGGIDGIVYDIDGNKILIQAKRYRSYINPKHITDFQFLLKRKHARKGYFVHTGKTSSNTRNLFQHTNVIIIGGSKLLKLIVPPIN